MYSAKPISVVNQCEGRKAKRNIVLVVTFYYNTLLRLEAHNILLGPIRMESKNHIESRSRIKHKESSLRSINLIYSLKT